MSGKLEHFDQVSLLLDRVLKLPLGHPDRLRLLTCAEEIIDGADPAKLPEELKNMSFPPIHHGKGGVRG